MLSPLLEILSLELLRLIFSSAPKTCQLDHEPTLLVEELTSHSSTFSQFSLLGMPACVAEALCSPTMNI